MMWWSKYLHITQILKWYFCWPEIVTHWKRPGLKEFRLLHFQSLFSFIWKNGYTKKGTVLSKLNLLQKI